MVLTITRTVAASPDAAVADSRATDLAARVVDAEGSLTVDAVALPVDVVALKLPMRERRCLRHRRLDFHPHSQYHGKR